MNTWKSENPPKDGTPIVAVGRVIYSDGLLTSVDPLCSQIFWSKPKSGYEGWCFYLGATQLAVASRLEDKVKIDFWIELPVELKEVK